MRIGILTYHCVTNFGAQLQTLSTIGYMKKHGHEPVVLNWFPCDLEKFYRKRRPQNQFDEQFNFAMTEMPVSTMCRTLPELCDVIDNLGLDAIFLGSDALFDYIPLRARKKFDYKKIRMTAPSVVTSNHDLPNPFWGSFNDYLKKKVPYCGFSISSQNMPYHLLSGTERKELKRLLLGFEHLTVRDDWTKKMVDNVSGRDDVVVTPDPVFAFNNNTCYNINKESIVKKYNLPDKYILISFEKKILSISYINTLIKKIENETGVTCVSFPMPSGLNRYNTQKYIDLPLPTLDWYYLIKYSQGYIGELMHPIIVCLHNSIPFFCFDQYGTYKTIIPAVWHKFLPKSSKIYDILQKAELLDNMYSYAHSIDKLPVNDLVSRFISFDREKCHAFSEAQYQKYADGMQKVLDFKNGFN